MSTEPRAVLAIDAAMRLKQVINPTTLISCHQLNQLSGTEIILASETFQRTGSFKFRAAYNVAQSVPETELITASSGNFGQALAYACQLLQKHCIVVMPETSARVKINAVRDYGAQVELVNVQQKSRAQRVKELSEQNPKARVISPYDDDLVIAGNASLGRELASMQEKFDCVVVPIGGGGLLAGVIQGLRSSGCDKPIWGAEPAIANDAARSLQCGTLLRNETEPQTIADGVRTLALGERNWPIIKEGVAGIVEVPEEIIVESTRHLFHKANLKVEPTGALSLAAVLTDPDRFRDQRTCCVVSGGNVDDAVLFKLIG